MTRSPVPDGPRSLALVLAGGGARAAYEVGGLSAIAERGPGLEVPIVTGLSPGAVNAAYLAAPAGTRPPARGAGRGQGGRLRPERAARAAASGLARDNGMGAAALPILFPLVGIGSAFWGFGSVLETAPVVPKIHLGAGAPMVVPRRVGPDWVVSLAPPRCEYPSLAE